MNTCC